MSEDSTPAAMPERIQLRRTKGWHKPENTVVVSRPSKWGNPFKVEMIDHEWRVRGLGRLWFGYTTNADAIAAAVELYRSLWRAPRNYFPDADLSKLRGHDLACWCPLDQPCHADVLLELANR